MRKVSIVFLVLLGVGLIAGLAVGTWHLDWFVREANTNRQSEVYQQSYGRQSSLVQAVTDDVAEVSDLDVVITQSPATADQLRAQRKAIIGRICSNAGLLTGTIPLPANAASFVAKECP